MQLQAGKAMGQKISLIFTQFHPTHLSDDGGQQHEAERQKDGGHTLAYSACNRRMSSKHKSIDNVRGRISYSLV